MDKLATFVVVWLGVYFVETLIVGSYGSTGFYIKGFIAIWPATVLAKREWPIWSKLMEAMQGHETKAVVIPGNSKIIAFGQTLDTPEFFAQMIAGLQPFDTWSYWEGKSGQTVEGMLRIDPKGPLNQRRIFESMLESARMLRADRGYPIRNRLNELNWPQIQDEGLLIETVDNDDGSRSAILAVELAGSLSKHDWARADANGFGSIAGDAWDIEPLAKAKVRKKEGSGHWRIETRAMPLFQLRLIERPLPGDHTIAENPTFDLPHDLPK